MASETDGIRDTLNRVVAYRQVCRAVRGGAGHTMFNGLLFLGLTAFVYRMLGPHPLVYVNAAIGVGEILIGVWKLVRPSPECVLLDSLFQFGFVASIAARQGLAVANGFPVNPISIAIALWCLFDAYRTWQAYFALRRAFVERPSAEHVAYVNDLARDVRAGDPDTDPAALDLSPVGLKAKLLGDLAVFADPGGEVFAVDASAVELARTANVDPSGRPVVRLRLYGNPHPEFGVGESTWRNYAKWKGVAA